ncbi:hypothetical protein BDN72DRAFT_398737 [Pluteus cervinus]|uniref:Uncharacterized protein n=1 Tax=Pluteus cervinus TaxID=181527 RepID=A0ACD3A927_9AGAR|nr:hypothetical protein BDN72DRAFT_398737 [Pluteus cervinus]
MRAIYNTTPEIERISSSTSAATRPQAFRIPPRKKVAAPGLRSSAKTKVFGFPFGPSRASVPPKGSEDSPPTKARTGPKPLERSGPPVQECKVFAVDTTPFGEERTRTLKHFSDHVPSFHGNIALEQMEAAYLHHVFHKTLISNRITADGAEELGPDGLEKLRLQQAEERSRIKHQEENKQACIKTEEVEEQARIKVQDEVGKARIKRRDHLSRQAELRRARVRQQERRVERPHGCGTQDQGIQSVVTERAVVNANPDPPRFIVRGIDFRQPSRSSMPPFHPSPEEWARSEAKYHRYLTLWDEFRSPTCSLPPIRFEQFPWPVSYEVYHPYKFTIDAVRGFIFNPFWRPGLSRRERLQIENRRWDLTAFTKLAVVRVDKTHLNDVVANAAVIYQILSDLWKEID